MSVRASISALRAAAGTCLLVLMLGTIQPAFAREPVSTSFTYQGELAAAGAPATGTFDLRFRLFDAAAGGVQVGSTLCSNDLLVENGRFSVSLDFGAAFAGEKRFLEIEVRQDAGQDCADASGYSALSPRQELTAAPSASFAQSAASLNGQSPSFYQNAANLTGTLPSSVLSGTYTGPLALTNAANVFTGDGSSITNLNATNMSSGTLDAARMPTNWVAGGDLSGFFPSPTINVGAVSLSKLSPSVQGVLAKLSSLPSAPAPAEPVAWGDNTYGQLNIPGLPLGVTYAAVSVGGAHSLGLGSDGTVVAWGNNQFGQLNVPALPPGVTYVAVAACNIHSLALRSDGTVAVWGRSAEGQLNVPALPPGMTYTALAGGATHSLALRSDGMVVAWGDNGSGQLNVPALPPGLTYSAVAAGEFHSLALRSNGTVVAWGDNFAGQLNVPALPPGLTYVSVTSGSYHCLAVRSDGTVAAWGESTTGQLNVPVLPPGVTFTAVAAGSSHSLALRSDGTLAAWGEDVYGQLNVPVLPVGVTYAAIAAGSHSNIALRQIPLVSALGTTVGLSIGGASPPPANGISVAGASSFASRVTATSFAGSGAQLTDLSATNITTGTLAVAQIPNFDASKITSGTLSLAQIPNLDASKITNGTLAAARIPNLDASKISTGTLNPALVPDLDASKITSGTLAEARLSSNIALKNAANVFTSTSVTSFAGGLGIAGNIGIGTTPNASDAIYASSGGNTQIAITGGGREAGPRVLPRTWAISVTGVSTLPGFDPVSTDNALQIVDRNQGSVRLQIDTAGNVGIGTLTPSQRLTVAGNVAADAFFGSGAALTNLSASNIASGTLSTARIPNLDASKIITGTFASAQIPSLDAAKITSGSLADTRLSTNIPLKNAANAFTSTGVTSFAGNLGIGTTTPGSQYSIEAVSGGDSQIALTSGPAIGGVMPPRTWSIQSSAVNSTPSSLNGTFQIIDRTGGASRFLIDTNGNVGIGTSAPTQRLTVAGNMNVTGTLAKAGGSFKIDHPLDPRNKYLYHSFVESPDMMNVYNGNVTTDAAGYATITMPDYFEALNRDFRYQLTVINEADTGEFLWAQVVRELKENEFTIRSSRGGVKVSWQITGIRHDAWAEKNRIPNSVDKVGAEKGTLLHPEVFNQPASAAEQPNVSEASH